MEASQYLSNSQLSFGAEHNNRREQLRDKLFQRSYDHISLTEGKFVIDKIFNIIRLEY